MKLTLAAGLVLLALSSCSMEPVLAEDGCRNIQQQTDWLVSQGFEVLGTEQARFSNGVLLYYAKDGMVFVGLILDGCVAGTTGLYVGQYVPEVSA